MLKGITIDIASQLKTKNTRHEVNSEKGSRFKIAARNKMGKVKRNTKRKIPKEWRQ